MSSSKALHRSDIERRSLDIPTQARAISKRIRQGFRAIKTNCSVIPRSLSLPDGLTPEQHSVLVALPSFDLAHLLAVHRSLVQRGITDRDLLLAGLFHDVGKHLPPHHVGLTQRVAKVILSLLAPTQLLRLTAERACLDDDLVQLGAALHGWRAGLHLAVHHPHIGAAIGRSVGLSDRTCWLIAHHEDATSTSDAELDLLRETDAAC